MFSYNLLKLSHIFMLNIFVIVTLNWKTLSFLTNTLITWKLSTSALLFVGTKIWKGSSGKKDFIRKLQEQYLFFLLYSLITCPQRCLPKVMIKDVTFGRRALYSTFCCQVLLLSTDKLKKKSWRRLRTFNTILTVILHLFSAWIQKYQWWGKRFDQKDIKTRVRKNYCLLNPWPSMVKISSKSAQH